MIRILTAATLALTATTAQAEEFAKTFVYDGSFEDATFFVEDAIISEGLVIDHVSHTGEMLERTGKDLGATVKIFDGADIFLFCSATISREVMEADPANVAFCPYSIFVTNRDGEVRIGYRTYPDGPMDKVEALLDGIVKEALGE